ncbi:MAG: magnesium transporter MgtE N-terminal domain-containing protein [Janthinobacterium lividum]
MFAKGSNATSASALLGTHVLDAEGRSCGRVQELAVDVAQDAARVSALIVRRRTGVRGSIPVNGLDLPRRAGGALRTSVEPQPVDGMEDALLLERDLLDQQIIDVDGRKVVRVNDVNLTWELAADGAHAAGLRIEEVETGLRGATRRLLHGLPQGAVLGVSERLAGSTIPWSCVDLIERDPGRRVRLKIGQERLAKLHPSDIADILEDLAPAEREAIFTSLPEETAAETLEEIDPRLQKELLQGMDSERAADILEEMDPGAAADVLAELSEEHSEAILGEMEPDERHDVEELLEFSADSAAGRMTTEYFCLATTATVADAVRELREFTGDPDNVTEVYLLDIQDHLAGVVSMSRLLLAQPEKIVLELAPEGRHVTCTLHADEGEVAELFDKYNLRALPVLDQYGRVTGVIHAEQVIAALRES